LETLKQLDLTPDQRRSSSAAANWSASKAARGLAEQTVPRNSWLWSQPLRPWPPLPLHPRHGAAPFGSELLRPSAIPSMPSLRPTAWRWAKPSALASSNYEW